MIDPILRDAESKMSKSVDHFGSELATIRTGRANPALIDKVMVRAGIPARSSASCSASALITVASMPM